VLSVNAMMATTTAAIRESGRVLAHVNGGAPTRPVQAEFQSELSELKHELNTVLERFGTAAAATR
jgi:hypothetical protein